MDDNDPPGILPLPNDFPGIPPLPPGPPDPSGEWSDWEPPPRPTGTFWQGLPEQTQGIAVAAVTLVVLVAVVLSTKAIFGNSTTNTINTNTTTATSPKTIDAASWCIFDWNYDRDGTKQYAGQFAFDNQFPPPNANRYGYASVRYSEAFPDRCMVTVGSPIYKQAEQFVQDASHHWSVIPAWTGPVSSLGSTILPWNAKIAFDGTITLGAP
ncbi:hypothetical protein [Actinacidiphila oryziradicis]|uniref:Uncharacterized protein n=1 Tax=Actinacidiphila oryziradicis TaxID=2571141 RepID=A0A4U0RUB0_9ACTN|nr:hypothetical protein [Actinacidiphila oryziradicis]TJZ99057.1 hypothetical protein FCI23_47225 [Actinacidiphila oryziradicis]